MDKKSRQEDHLKILQANFMYRTILIGTCRSGNFRATAHDLDKHTQKQHKKDSRSNFYRCDPIAFYWTAAKKVPITKTNRKNICDQTNTPKKKLLTAFPIAPPIPKLLIKSKMEIARITHRITSSVKLSCCISFFLRPEFVFLPEVFLPEELFLSLLPKYYPPKISPIMYKKNQPLRAVRQSDQ